MKPRIHFVPFGERVDSCGRLINLTEPGERFEVRAQPQRPFKPMWLLVPRSHAHAFVIERIRIGTELVALAAGSVPAECFASDLEDLAARIRDGEQEEVERVLRPLLVIEYPPMMPGMEFAVAGRNVGAYRRAFTGMLIGTVPEW